MINPDIKPAHELRAWFDSQGRERVSAFESLSKGRTPGGGGGDWRKSFAQVRDEKLGTKDKVGTRHSLCCASHHGCVLGRQPDYFSVRATVTYLSNNFDKPPWFADLRPFGHEGWLVCFCRYMACPNRKEDGKECNRKVVEDDRGVRCEHCQKTMDRGKPRSVRWDRVLHCLTSLFGLACCCCLSGTS